MSLREIVAEVSYPRRIAIRYLLKQKYTEMGQWFYPFIALRGYCPLALVVKMVIGTIGHGDTALIMKESRLR